MTQQTRWSRFLVLVTVLFFWGFAAANNDILIPVFKNALDPMQVQRRYVAIAFCIACTVGLLIYFFTSMPIGSDVLNRTGYKKKAPVDFRDGHPLRLR